MLKGYTTHNILTAVGYKPSGHVTGAPSAAPAPVVSPEVVVRKSKRLNYVPNKPDPARLAPGVVKLTVGDPTGYRDLDDYKYKPSADLTAALVVAQHMYEESQMPHQWVKQPLPEDNSGNEIEEYFNHISEEQFEAKVESLKQQGFSDEQIEAAVARMREKEIDKALKAPFMRPGGIPGSLSKVYAAKAPITVPPGHYISNAAATFGQVLPSRGAGRGRGRGRSGALSAVPSRATSPSSPSSTHSALTPSRDLGGLIAAAFASPTGTAATGAGHH